MSRTPAGHRAPIKDMYWFAHGGIENNDKCLPQRSDVDDDTSDTSAPSSLKYIPDRRTLSEEQKAMDSLSAHLVDGVNASSPLSFLEREDRVRPSPQSRKTEEKRKLLRESEQEKSDSVLKKNMEREAALEARRNAQRSTISFAFGSSVPRNLEALPTHSSGESERMSRSPAPNGLSHKGEDVMWRSMTAAAPRGRRKNDLTPTVPYDRTGPPRSAASARKRSVSMTRLDQLAQPRRHYVDSSVPKENVRSPTRPLSSASEQSGGAGSGGVQRRLRTSPRKPRPVTIAGTLPDLPSEGFKASPIKKNAAKKASNVRSTPLKTEKPKPAPRMTPKPSTRQSTIKHTTPKVSPEKKSVNKKKADISVSTPAACESVSDEATKSSVSPARSTSPEGDAENEKNSGKRIISEEEAKAALAEKRRLAREQAEKEAELERQRQEQLKREEEDRLRREEEDQLRMEEEQLRLLEEHQRQEKEKLRKAIEEQERKEEEEKAKREEDLRQKTEQERKAKEEAEKQRIELEEKLRKEEEERAERKKRLEKIMSRTRGKTNSPSGSISGSDQLDSSENQQEGFSSGANSLDSNELIEPAKSEHSSIGDSLEANPTYEAASRSESLNSNDLMMPNAPLVPETKNEADYLSSENLMSHDLLSAENQEQKLEENINEEIQPVSADNMLIPEDGFHENLASMEEMYLPDPESTRTSTSEMKLPDPIYETSDDGSISSEKHQQLDTFLDEKNADIGGFDDVFSEQEVAKQVSVVVNPFSVTALNENPIQSEDCSTSNVFEYEAADCPVELPQKIEENVTPESEMQSTYEENKDYFNNLGSEETPFYSNFSNENSVDPLLSGDGANVEVANVPNVSEFNPFSTTVQQVDVKSSESSNELFSDVTVIMADGSGDCIGIISSLDSGSFESKEHLKSNLEPRVTDSEDSSLDSNLSQVMTEKEMQENLNNVASVDERDYLFNVQQLCNGDSLSKPNGVTISNGHSSEEIREHMNEFHDLGKDISSVDHHKDNIYDNVDAIDFSKVSSDPFLAKGNSNQSNPFLMQDEQKQVLMTPDFFN